MPDELPFEDFQALYGRWRPFTPSQVATLLETCGFRWWIGGGWAVDAASGTTRPHEDTDVVVLRDDLPAVRHQLRQFHLWEADSGSLRPLTADTSVRDDVAQLWVRSNAYSPWVLDLLLTPTDGADWLYKRDPTVRRPLEDIGFAGPAGIPYLRPEIVLLFKAKLGRAKDEADLQTLLPHLTSAARAFLANALVATSPGHPWLALLAD